MRHQRKTRGFLARDQRNYEEIKYRCFKRSATDSVREKNRQTEN